MDSFRTEFADVAVWARTLPRPSVPLAGPIVATLHGIGAFWLTSALIGGATGVLFMFVERPQMVVDSVVRQDLPIREAVALLAALVGTAVTRASGGWRAAGLLAAVFAVTEAGSFAVTHFTCDRVFTGFPAGSMFDYAAFCPTAATFVTADVPRVIAGLVGLAVAPVVTGGRRGFSALLIAAAVVPIWSALTHLVTVLLTPARVNDISVSVAVTVLAAVMWALVGVTLRVLLGGPLALLVLALTLVPPAAFGIQQAIVIPVGGDMRLWPLASIGLNVAFVVVLVLGWALSGPSLPLGTADAPSTGETDS